MIEGMSKKEKGKKKKSSVGSGTIRGTTKEGAGMLYQKKCTREWNEVFQV